MEASSRSDLIDFPNFVPPGSLVMTNLLFSGMRSVLISHLDN